MDLRKIELKTAIIQDYVARAQTIGEGHDDDLLRLEGTVGALKLAANTLSKNKEFYRKKLHAEELTQDEYKLIMETVDRDIGALISMAETAKVEAQMKRGRVQGIKEFAEILEKDHAKQIENLQNFRTAIETGTVTLDENGTTARPERLSKAEEVNARRRKKASDRKSAETK